MIFSRIFSPAYSHRDPQKRILAIANLSPDKGNEKSVLHELAFNDESASVSIAALEKLDSFALWLKMSQIAKDAQLRRKANQYVENALLNNHNDQIPLHELSEYLVKQAPVELVRKILQSPVAKSLADDVILTLLEKAAKGDFTQQYFVNFASPAIQAHIIANESDEAVLNRLLKKTNEAGVKTQLENRLVELKLKKEKPIEVEKDTTLLLSKLQAVTSKLDYQDVAARIAEYEAQFNLLQQDFPVLSADKKLAFEEKYHRLMQKAHGHCDQVKEKWDAQQAKQRLHAQYSEAQQKCQSAQEKVSWLYQERLCEATLAEVEGINDQVRELEDHLPQFETSVSAQHYTTLKTAILALASRLERFSAQQQIGKRVHHFLVEAEALGAKIEANAEADIVQAFTSIKQQWRNDTSLLDTLPTDWKKRWNRVEKQVKSLNHATDAKREQSLKACRRLLSIITSLLDKGRFRSAMGRFRDLESLYNEMDEVGQGKLERRFAQIKDDISHLEGWQSYLAAPRKPALLNQAQTLAAEPAADIAQRSETIKLLRQQWQSLSAGMDKDEQDVAFDEALEQAFAPCRAFYAEQEKVREQNVRHREALIATLGSLDTEVDDLGALAKQVEKLKVQWRDAGAVDKSQYEELKIQWLNTLTPIQECINQWYGKNREQKQAIIKQAKALLENQDSEDKGTQAKQLQQAWKKIGNAGRRYETKLWQVFKETNDAIFDGLKSRRQAEQQQDDEQVQALIAKLDAIEVNNNAMDVETVILDVVTKMEALPKAKRSGLEKRIAKLRLAVANGKENQKQASKQQQLSQLQQLISAWVDNNEVESISQWREIGKNWQQIIRVGKPDENRTRSWYATVLEILTGLPSPQAEAGSRQQVQLAMLSDKMERGEALTLSEGLSAWLAYGQPSQDEVARLNVVLDEVKSQPALLVALH
ncbi:DUF349 domain-containing protein [Alteromonas sp. C1M14]|uniref:DUF349 domain-containing protein n=1 Tax=Alteromonas sp. C1M14 TaxID=2841567 RepID=UPI001C08A8A5|nr:DUF349 domain-containing protein [Alteromonas sp. C1M14]MBU2977034.1 DUF349 domain-containing protein [Alteromonas sp. C1M14]